MIATDTGRLLEAMTDAGLDQSKLADEVGCSPGAINQIVGGGTRHSRLMPEIARVLGVNYHWLMGKDVPKEAPGVVPQQLPRAEADLLAKFRSMGGKDRLALERVVDAFDSVARAKVDRAPPPLLPDQLTLTAMFRGILDHIDSALSKDEQAKRLAEMLPIALPMTITARPDLAYYPEEENQNSAPRRDPVASR